MERDIKEVISQVNKTGSDILSIDSLGRTLSFMGVYQILYNENNDTNEMKEKFSKRFKAEEDFHNEFWKLLKNTIDDYVSCDLFVETMLILYKPSYNSLRSLAEELDSIL